EQDQAGNQRGELIQQEYNARVQTAKDALAIGGITEEEYSNLVEEAAHKRSEAEKEYNAQLERTAQLKKEIAQAEAEAQLRGIDRNPLLTNQQRAQQSMPLWQSELSANQADVAAQQGIMNANPAGSQAALEAQAKKNELLAQQADLQEKINAAQNADNISYQMDVEIAKLQNVGTVAQQTAAAFGAAWTEAVNSISTNLSKVIQGTESWHRALINIYNAVLNEIVTSIVKMAVQWILQHTLMAAFSSAWNAIEAGKFAAMTQTKVATHAAGEGQMTIFTMLGSLARQGWHLAETIFHGLMVAMRVAAHIAGEVLSTAITLANAILRAGYYLITAIIGAMSAEAQIPYVGPILAVVAAAAIAAAGAAAMGGFDAGGYTGAGPVDEVAGVVHRGEFVIPASAVSRVGVGNLESIRNGSFRSMDSVSPAASSAANKTSVYTFMDPRQMADHLEKNDDHEKY
ncbi:MAG: hypothetical protein P4L96_20390, partial [Rhodoferax sp.]|nr:hypothetical protein [Rhodoferax sp.]